MDLGEMIKRIKKAFSIYKQEGMQGILRAIYLKGGIKDFIFGILFCTCSKMTIEDKKEVKKLMAETVDENSILIIEACDHHCECIPAFAHYWEIMGYNVHVLVTRQEYLELPLKFAEMDYIPCYGMSRKAMREVLTPRFLNCYKYIFFNSTRVFIPAYSITTTVFQLFSGLKKYRQKLFLVEHAPELLTKKEVHDNSVIVIADFPIKLRRELTVVIPSYFGKYKSKDKVGKVTFIIVGAINLQTRNHKLIENGIDYLVEKGIENFEIVIIGRTGNMDGIPEKYKKYLRFLGRLNYPDMYREIQKAHFFLPLLDPDNASHLQYNYTRSSGSFQLIYGFRIPCLIERTFAEPHMFSSQNSIIYEENEQFPKAMEIAVCMGQKEYNEKVESLGVLTEGIERTSVENLRGLLNNG